jgi:glycosyltransferase involved in cell wall biosynthesis
MTYKIAAIICTYNRVKYLINALNSLSNQTIPSWEFQVIIIDNNSSDNTATVANKFIEQHPFLSISYYLEKTRGLSAARNRGWKEANASIIAYMDDDAIADQNWLHALLTFFSTHENAVGAGGKVIPLYETGEPIWMSKYLNGYSGKVNHGETHKLYNKKMKYPSGCNMAWRKDALEKVGGFNEELHFRSDDKYIFFKVKEISDEIWWVPDAVVNHTVDDERLHFENFRKLYLKTGNEEKIRLHGSMKKLLEYIIKLSASIIIFILFLLKGQREKGRYIFLSQYYTLKGFLMQKVIVR